MNRPYNTAFRRGFSQNKDVNLGVFLVIVAVCSLGISCRKSVPTTNQTSMRPSSEAIAEAGRLYEGRADLMKARQAIVTLRQAQADDPTNYEIAWRLAEFNYFLGSHSSDSGEQDKAFREGIEAGKLAVKLQDGSAYMVLGQVYLESPTLLGGDTQKAVSYLEKGLRLGPDNELMRLRLAEAYAQAHRNEDARKQIDTLLAMKPAPGYETEYKEAVEGARKL